MTKTLIDEIREYASNPAYGSQEVRQKFLARAEQGDLTRDADAQSHFCTYFLPYNPITRKIFITHHKKAGMWVSPGGHIDSGETLMQTVRREIREELGVECKTVQTLELFLLTITPIDNEPQRCKVHYDFWCLFPTDGTDFKVDPTEFHETRWVTFEQARQLVSDPANLQAFQKIEEMSEQCLRNLHEESIRKQ
ncbi:MAG: NUDIX domain-containing protein [Verrucomicrobia bacterium]|nr:NUDIX domain-containing protein [Verrucomicrobiota bacterium]